MAINTYTTLVAAVGDWLDRDDIDSGISNMIALMEARLYRRVRLRGMESALSVAIASGVAALPSDFIGLKTAYLSTDPVRALDVKSAQFIYKNYPTRSADSRPSFVAAEGDNLIFGPYPDSAYTVTGQYYARPTALSTSNETNFLTEKWPDLLLYGTLVHSALYLGQDSRVQAWEAAYEDSVREVELDERRGRFPDSMPLASSPQ